MGGQGWMAAEEEAGGTGDALALARRHRLGRLAQAVARLHLDDGQRAAAAGDDVDLAERRAQVARQDAIALQAQAPQRQPLATPATTPVRR